MGRGAIGVVCKLSSFGLHHYGKMGGVWYEIERF